MSDRLEEALIEVLARIEAGEDVSTEELRATYPDCWEAIRDVFEIRGRLADVGGTGAAFAKPRVAQETKLRVVDFDRYEGFRLLGEGGMGMVYWALDTELNREVAFKVVRPDGRAPRPDAPAEPIGVPAPRVGTPASLAFETLKARFLQEAWVTAGLEHPGIVPVYEVGQTPNGVPYYTMRFVRGSRTLSQAMSDLRTRPVEERLALLDPFLRVCDTMRYAHAHGVVHRDLKPDNIALGEFGEVVVLDWGIAKIRDRPDAAAETWKRRLDEFRDATDLRTQVGALGTPGYMSPEAATGRIDEVDERSDVYSLGAILFQLLTGRLPYEFRTFGELLRAMTDGAPPDPASIDPAIPVEISTICARSLSRDRNERQQSVDALATDLRAWRTKRARDHEVEVLEHEANAAMAAAADLEGDALLRQLDRVHSAATKLLDRAPDANSAKGLLRDAERRREIGIRQREHATRRRTLRRAGFVGLAAALVVAVSVAWVINGERDQTEFARDAARAAVAAKDVALDRMREERDAKALAHKRAAGMSLAAASLAVTKNDPGLALALAVEAAARRPGLEANTALLAALSADPEYRRSKDPTNPTGLDAAMLLPGGREVVLVSSNGWARVVELDTGRMVRRVHAPGNWFRSTVASRDGRVFVTCGENTLLACAVFDASFAKICDLDLPKDFDMFSPTFSGDGSRIAFIGVPRAVTSGPERAKWPVTLFVCDVATGAVAAHDSCEMSPEELAGRTPVSDLTGSEWFIAGRRWTRSTGFEMVAECVTPPGAARCAIGAWFAPEGLRIAYAVGSDGVSWKIQIADSGAAVIREFAAGATPPAWADLAAGGAHLVVMHADAVCEVWDIASERRIATCRVEPAETHDAEAATLARGLELVRRWKRPRLSPDGMRFLVAGRFATSAVVFDARTGEKLASIICDQSPFSTTFGPASELIASKADDGAVRVWRMRRGVPRTLSDAIVSAVAFSPDGRCIASAHADGTCLIEEATTGVLVATFDTRSEHSFECLVYSPDGRYVVTCPRGPPGDEACRSVQVWDAATGAPTGTWTGLKDSAWSVVFSRDGRRLAAFAGGEMRLWDFPSGRNAKTLVPQSGATHWFCTPAFSPDGGTVALAARDGSVELWDASNGARIRTLNDASVQDISITLAADPRATSTATADCLVFSVDGTLIISGARDGTVRVWESATGKLVRRIALGGGMFDEHAVHWLAIHPDGKRIAVASADGTARVFRLETGEELLRLASNVVRLHLVEFSRDGLRLLTATKDGIAQIWDATTGAELVRYGRSDERWLAGTRSVHWPPALASLSPDGTRVATAGTAGAAAVWPADPLAAAVERSPRPLLAAERARFVDPLEYDESSLRTGRRLVNALYDELRVVVDVAARVEANQTLDADVRAAAMHVAHERTDDPDQLGVWSWENARIPEVTDGLRQAMVKQLGSRFPLDDAAPANEAAARRLSERWAEVAASIAPGDADLVTTLGAAQYRNREFAAAETTLRRSDTLGAGPNIVDAAFLAMTLARLGRRDEAVIELDRLEKLAVDYAASSQARDDLNIQEKWVLLLEARCVVGEVQANRDSKR